MKINTIKASFKNSETVSQRGKTRQVRNRGDGIFLSHQYVTIV